MGADMWFFPVNTRAVRVLVQYHRRVEKAFDALAKAEMLDVDPLLYIKGSAIKWVRRGAPASRSLHDIYGWFDLGTDRDPQTGHPNPKTVRRAKVFFAQAIKPFKSRLSDWKFEYSW